MTLFATAVGRLTRDPKRIDARRPLATATIVIDVSTGRDPNGVHLLHVLAGGRAAEALLLHQQGDMIHVSGRMQRRQARDGAELQLHADSIMSARTPAPRARPADAPTFDPAAPAASPMETVTYDHQT